MHLLLLLNITELQNCDSIVTTTTYCLHLHSHNSLIFYFFQFIITLSIWLLLTVNNVIEVAENMHESKKNKNRTKSCLFTLFNRCWLLLLSTDRPTTICIPLEQQKIKTSLIQVLQRFIRFIERRLACCLIWSKILSTT